MGSPLSPPEPSLAGTPPGGIGADPATPRNELRLYLRETAQLFNSMDPAPFRERDLDPKAEAYIVDWAREAPARAPLGLVIHLGCTSTESDDAATLTGAVHAHFRESARSTRRRLRRLFRVGRISLAIGLTFVALTVVAGEFLASLSGLERYIQMIVDSLVIGAWVALWRPLEIFLYDWWPIRAEARLYERLSRIDVQVTGPKVAAGAMS